MRKKIIRWLQQNHIVTLQDKCIVITGATSGIGYEFAKIACYLKASLILAVRNVKKGEEVKAELEASTNNAKVRVMELDLASFQSIDQFVMTLTQENINIDIFYNNAGVFRIPNATTSNNFELVMGTNYIGTFYLTAKLLPYLLKLKHKVTYLLTSSIAARFGKVKFDDFFFENNYHSMSIYASSKLCISRMFYYLSLYLKDTNVKTILVHPGITGTPLIKKAYKNKVISHVIPLVNFLFNSPDKSALCSVLAIQKQSNNGEYFGPRGFMEMSGYPHKSKLKNKEKKEADKTIEFTESLLNIKLI